LVGRKVEHLTTRLPGEKENCKLKGNHAAKRKNRMGSQRKDRGGKMGTPGEGIITTSSAGGIIPKDNQAGNEMGGI